MFVLGARRAQDVAHRVVAFVAGVFEQVAIRAAHQRNAQRPRPHPRLRVVDGRLVGQRSEVIHRLTQIDIDLKRGGAQPRGHPERSSGGESGGRSGAEGPRGVTSDETARTASLSSTDWRVGTQRSTD